MIYFITARQVGKVKIGYAENAQSRFTSFKTHSPVPLELERVKEGGNLEEAKLHALFADARSHGEWFNLTAEIEAFMAALPRHEWKHRGWHHAARRATPTPATSGKAA